MKKENGKIKERDEIQEWLDKGNKITILPYYEPKVRKRFGKVGSKTRRRNIIKGLLK